MHLIQKACIRYRFRLLLYIYVHILYNIQLLIYPLQVKNKPDDSVAIIVFNLGGGVVTNSALWELL
jgi:hypothetical protein